MVVAVTVSQSAAGCRFDRAVRQGLPRHDRVLLCDEPRDPGCDNACALALFPVTSCGTIAVHIVVRRLEFNAAAVGLEARRHTYGAGILPQSLWLRASLPRP